MHPTQSTQSLQAMHATQPLQFRHHSIPALAHTPALRITNALPATPVLKNVPAEKATAALVSVPALPATAVLIAVPALPATAALIAVPALPATAALIAVPALPATAVLITVPALPATAVPALVAAEPTTEPAAPCAAASSFSFSSLDLATLSRGSARPGQEALLAGQRLAGGRGDLHRNQLAGSRQAGEVDHLVVARAAPQARGVGARGPLDQDLQRAPHEPLRALGGAALNQLHQALHARHLDAVGYDALAELRRLGPSARGEDEGEGAVVADLVDHLERLLEVGFGLTGKADDDVGAQGAVGHVLADQGHPIEVALAVIRAAHRPEDARGSRLQGQVDVLAQRGQLGVGPDHVLAHVLGVGAGVAEAR